jgi:hypothetical protein
MECSQGFELCCPGSAREERGVTGYLLGVGAAMQRVDLRAAAGIYGWVVASLRR